jgi:phosphatidylethanolamine-binding protein (PEBP) family uncharacterized protein
MFSTLVISLALLPYALTQETLDVKAIEAHFSQSHLVPDLFASFNPSALLSLDYAGVGVVKPGQLLTKEQVSPTPTVTVTPANSSVSLNGTYTIAMVDADVVGSKLPEGQTRHWLVNGVTISGSSVANSSATAITSYAGPWPASGSGPHRYVVVIYAQPPTFAAPAAYSQSNLPVGTFDFNSYVKDSGLGPLVAANYITVEEGTATAAIPSTSAVVTSTLLPSSAVQTSSKSSSASAPSGSNTSGAINVSAQLFGFIATFVLAIVII